MTAQSATLAASTILYVCFSAKHHAFAFSTGGGNSATSATPTIFKAPIAKRQEWQKPGVEIELPNMDLLFDRISTASPLAKLVMEGDSKEGGFEAIDDDIKGHPELKYKKVEDNKRKTVHRIDKADKYQGLKTPLLRFRSSIKGPCIGERFSNMIMDYEERKKWDDQVAKVEELYPIEDLDAINAIQQDKYGTCTKLGVGYTRTKQGIISPREQLTLAGMQEWSNGATILWGTEMEESHNYLLPEDQKRHTRAKSHLFAATLAPTGPNSFDVEYLLQMDVGGNIPHFMTTPALTDTVKKLFEHTKTYFGGGEGSELDMYLKATKAKQEQVEAEYSDVELLRNMDDELLEADIDFTHHDAMDDMKSLLFTP